MWDRDLKAQILANFIICDVEKLVSDHDPNSLQHPLDVLHENFPNLTDDEIVELLNIIIHVYNLKHTEKVDLVATLPSHYKTQALPTISVISDLIDSAKTLIMITGYSISDYAEDLLMKIIEKSRSGIMVKIFVNKFDPTESPIINKLDMYKGRYLEIYKYVEQEDDMAALHAKTISVDDSKSLITSANLSFHGLEKNIELGCLIDSSDYGKKLHSLFSDLIETRKVKKVY